MRLDHEGNEKLAWCGLSVLRQILGDKRHDFWSEHYQQLEQDQRYAILGALVIEHRDALDQALASELESQPHGERIQTGVVELDRLAIELQCLASRLASVAEELRMVDVVWQERIGSAQREA